MTSYANKIEPNTKWTETVSEPVYKTVVPPPNFSTNAIHEGQEAEKIHGAINVPIYYSSTFKQHEPGVLYSKHDYSRASNPTVDVLNECLASLEYGKYALTFSSGCGATTCVLATLKAGDHVISIDDVYGGTNRLMNRVMGKFGLQVEMIDLTPKNLEVTIKENTKMLWIETPTNPTLKIADIEALCAVAKKHNVITVVDNTFASPYLQSPLLLGADIVIHSCTKYLGGHSDIIAGAVVTNDPALYTAIKFNLLSIGTCISPMDAYVLLRSTKTLKVRMEEHCKNANIIAKYLANHPKVVKVLFPGLESHPGHQIAKKQMRNFGGMISCELKGDADTAKKFMKNLKIFTLAESLGGIESLVESPALMTHLSVPPEQRLKLGISDSLIRLSVGIESIEDLLDDLENALAQI